MTFAAVPTTAAKEVVALDKPSRRQRLTETEGFALPVSRAAGCFLHSCGLRTKHVDEQERPIGLRSPSVKRFANVVEMADLVADAE